MKATTRLPKDDPADETDAHTVMSMAALMMLAEKFPHRQFNTTELSILSGLGRTALSQVKNASDTPFSCGKCSLPRLERWLASHPGLKAS
jgi:hypothetical protein